VDLVQRTRDLVEKEYNAGQGSLVRLNEAQRDLTTAQSNLALALVGLRQAWVELETRTGNILATYGPPNQPIDQRLHLPWDSFGDRPIHPSKDWLTHWESPPVWNRVKKNPMYLYLVVLTIASTVGLQAWTTLFNNFAVEVARLDGDGIGMIQSIREIPGFLALLAIFVIRLIPEHRLSALSILLLGLGIAATGWFPSFAGLALTTLVMSFGFHYYETTNMSLTLQYFDKHASPWVFGKLRSISAASSIVVGAFIFLMASALDFTHMYLIIGGFIVAHGRVGIHPQAHQR
jgi:hypothetical protein